MKYLLLLVVAVTIAACGNNPVKPQETSFVKLDTFWSVDSLPFIPPLINVDVVTDSSVLCGFDSIVVAVRYSDATPSDSVSVSPAEFGWWNTDSLPGVHYYGATIVGRSYKVGRVRAYGARY